MAFPALRIQTSQMNDVLVVRPVGWVGADGHAALEERLHKVQSEGHRRVVVDLSTTHFVSSTGLGVFLYFHQSLKDSGGRLVLAAPGGAVQKMLAAANLDKALFIRPTLPEAIELARRSSSSRRRQKPVAT